MSPASTHTEVYRPFEGGLQRFPLRALVLARSGISQSLKKKLPLLLLYTIPAITTIVSCFLVHLKFKAEADQVPGADAAQVQMVAAMAESLFAVSQLITNFVTQVSPFALLAISWYGAGLIAEDHRLGAHLLYFSRPLSRFDYILGKFLSAGFFGACAMLFPALLICSTAAFSSPDWSFVTEQADVIAASIGFSLLWITTLSSLVLAISSLVGRKSLALAGVIGVLFLAHLGGHALAEITGDGDWRMASPMTNFARVADWMFERPSQFTWDPLLSLYILGSVTLLAFVVLWRRVKRMEVVA